MIHLAQHIEILLLENDCVVIPGFGGFIAHNMPAVWNKEENLFIPPTRVIGFNPQLKMNDGVLVQAYMKEYGTNYVSAYKRLEREISELTETLHEEGKVELPFIGEVHYSANNIYAFSPYENKLASPSYYGLSSFEMQELTSLLEEEKEVAVIEKKEYTFRFLTPVMRNAVAIAAAIMIFFFLSTPIENTYVEENNYAHILPTELFDKIKGESLITTAISNPYIDSKPDITTIEVTINDQSTVKPVAVKEVKVPQPEIEVVESETPIIEELNYHLIVASVSSEAEGNNMVEKLLEKGYSKASLISGDGRIRVSIASYATREEATNELFELRKIKAYQNAWLLTK